MKNIKNIMILLLTMGSVSGLFASGINITNKYFKNINITVYPKNTSSFAQYSIASNEATVVDCKIGDSIIIRDDSGTDYMPIVSRRKFITQLNGQYDIVLGRNQESLWMVQKGGSTDLFNVKNHLKIVNKYSNDIYITIYYGNNLSKGNPPATTYIATRRYYAIKPDEIISVKCEIGDSISIFSKTMELLDISSGREIISQLNRQYIAELSEDGKSLAIESLPMAERVELTKSAIDLKNKLNTLESNYNRFNEKVGGLRKKKFRSKKQRRALSRYRKARDSYRNEMNSLADQIAKIKADCPSCVAV